MKKLVSLSLFFFALMLTTSPGWTTDSYRVNYQQILDVKAVYDDPTPLYTETNDFKIWIPDDVWEKITWDIDEMKKAWAEAVGFKAPDVVGKIVPEITPGKYTLADKEKYPFKELMIPNQYM